jgi:hypothetical protein
MASSDGLVVYGFLMIMATFGGTNKAHAQEVVQPPDTGLSCEEAAPLIQKLWEKKGSPIKPFILKYKMKDYPYKGFEKISVSRSGEKTSITLKGDSYPMQDTDADGVVDKVRLGLISRYDSSETDSKGNFSKAEKVYEEECERLLPALHALLDPKPS